MTPQQIAVIKKYSFNKLGAIKFDNKWRWLSDIHNDHDLAARPRAIHKKKTNH